VRARFAARSRERGATLFVVVLVMTLLMGIGAFAARSAALATAASGSERQYTQARYVAEYALNFAASVLSNGGAQAYLQQVRTPPSTLLCYGQNVNMPQRTCYRMLLSDLQLGTGINVCDPVNGTARGSLGMANAECDFAVELTDLSEGFTMPGFDLGHGKALKFWYVTASATGQVRIVNTSGTAALSPTSAESSSTQTMISRILVGPLPTN
jgi:Tfp pilus assembly protein PilX